MIKLGKVSEETKDLKETIAEEPNGRPVFPV